MVTLLWSEGSSELPRKGAWPDDCNCSGMARRTESLGGASFKGDGVEMTAGFMQVRRKCPTSLSCFVFQHVGAWLWPGLSKCERTGTALVLYWGTESGWDRYMPF